jgi:DtxR family manganese transport transcriptional regulator
MAATSLGQRSSRMLDRRRAGNRAGGTGMPLLAGDTPVPLPFGRTRPWPYIGPPPLAFDGDDVGTRARPLPLRAETQATTFDRTRSDHRSEIAEDYVELIADLIDVTGEARAVDLALRLGVSGATVNGQITKLQRAGLVHSEPYRSIFLTDHGRALAEHCRRRHHVVLGFLRAIGVSEKVAETDAEGIEHHVSDETLTALETAMRRLKAGE